MWRGPSCAAERSRFATAVRGPGSIRGCRASVLRCSNHRVAPIRRALFDPCRLELTRAATNLERYRKHAGWSTCRQGRRIERSRGTVQVNQGGGQVVGQSYGGYKQGGVGREATLEGMIAGFTQTK